MVKNRVSFSERILRGGVEGRLFWEHFFDEKKKRIYEVKGYFPRGNPGQDSKQKFSIQYLDNSGFSSKSLEEAFDDVDAYIFELIENLSGNKLLLI